MSKEVKLFFIMPGAVPVLQSDSPAYTPMTNCETDVHTVPVVLGEDYDALLAENETLRDLYKMHQQTETREMLDLRAERDALLAERDRLREDRDSQQRVCIAEMEKVNQLRAEAEALKKGAERAGMRIKELDLLFGRYLLAMKAAVIDSDQRGDEEGMRWIYNSLAGPGELPPDDEVDAQAFFDREIKPINDGLAEVMAYHRASLQGEQP